MLMDVIMESLMSMDEETLNYALESMSEDEMEIINGYLDEINEQEDDDIATEAAWAKDTIGGIMDLDEDGIDGLLESVTDEEFEYLESACEKAINFDRSLYDSRSNPSKFIITPAFFVDAGIPKDQAEKLYDTIVDYMASHKYITYGRKELPEKIAEHFKTEERKIVAKNITEMGWRYVKKAKALYLKDLKSGKPTDMSTFVDTVNAKTLSSANAEVIGKTVLKSIGAIAGGVALGFATAYGLKPVWGANVAGFTGNYVTGIATITNGLTVARDYSESKRSINRVASRA